MSVTRLMAIGLVAFMPAYGFAASFDCANASTTVDKLICATPDLSLDDENLAASYQRAASQDAGFQASEREWLTQRNRCADADCLRAAYIARLDQLSSVSNDRPMAENSTVAHDQEAQAVGQATSGVGDSAPNPQLASAPDGVNSNGGSVGEMQAASSVNAAPGEASQAGDPNISASAPDTGSTAATQQTASTSSPDSDAASVPADGEGKSDFWSDVKAFGVIAAIVAFLIWRTKCSKCGKLFSKQELGRDLVDEQYGFETVTREDKHKDNTGKVFKTVERQEQVQVVHRSYNVFHRCRHCDHRWTTTKTTKTSG